MKTKTPMQAGAPSIPIAESSGNLFADLGLANPEQELLKARLTLQIYRSIKERKLTQAQAGEILGIKQPHVSSLMRGQSGLFSVERLMDFPHGAWPRYRDRGQSIAQETWGNVRHPWVS